MFQASPWKFSGPAGWSSTASTFGANGPGWVLDQPPAIAFSPAAHGVKKSRSSRRRVFPSNENAVGLTTCAAVRTATSAAAPPAQTADTPAFAGGPKFRSFTSQPSTGAAPGVPEGATAGRSSTLSEGLHVLGRAEQRPRVDPDARAAPPRLRRRDPRRDDRAGL